MLGNERSTAHSRLYHNVQTRQDPIESVKFGDLTFGQIANSMASIFSYGAVMVTVVWDEAGVRCQ